LKMQQFSRIVLAATHGRGMFQSTGTLGVTEISSTVPHGYSLGQNYPNPFNPTTIIPFSIADRGHINLTVYDETGRRVATLIDRDLTPGSYHTDFNASNLASGVYFYRLTSGSSINELKKMILIK
jgi:hypothetical protein